MEQQIETSILTEEAVIENEIKKFDKFDSRIAELRKQYSGLKIASIDDKEGYEAVRLALADLRSIRTGTESERKEAKALYIEVGKRIDGAAKRIVESVKEIEEPLQTQKDVIDAEKDRLKEEKRRKLDGQFAERTNILNRMGATFDGEGYVLAFNAEKEAYYKIAAIRESEPDYWEGEMLPKYQAISDLIAEQRFLEETKRKEEEERIAKERAEFEQKRRELEEQQAELKRQQELLQEEKRQQEFEEQRRKEKAEKELLNRRGQQLLDLGLVRNMQSYEFLPTRISIAEHVMKICNDEEWSFTINTVIKEVGEYREKEAVRLKKEQEEKEEAIRKQAIADQQRKQAEEERLKQEAIDASTDREKWTSLMQEIKGIFGRYTFKSIKYRKMFTQLKENSELL